jgi:hypothetical protein
MIEQQFEKALTANDTGHSGGHQAGIHVPKGERELLAFLPQLNFADLNPSVWLSAHDDQGVTWRLRYIYYNNKFHSPGGTRDEFRITHLTKFFRAVGAVPGATMIISGEPGAGVIRISVKLSGRGPHEPATVRLRGWRRVH